MKLNMLNEWNKIYEKNSELDKIYLSKYLSSNNDIFEKNAIEFLVELGEFTNESKCFKYWTVKLPDKEKVLEEYADCITMLLVFYNNLNMKINPEINHLETVNILEVINYLYQEGSKILKSISEELLTNIFNNLIYLGSLLNLTEEEIINSMKNKQKIVEVRLNSEY